VFDGRKPPLPSRAKQRNAQHRNGPAAILPASVRLHRAALLRRLLG
jgi:hypothetical protein